MNTMIRIKLLLIFYCDLLINWFYWIIPKAYCNHIFFTIKALWVSEWDLNYHLIPEFLYSHKRFCHEGFQALWIFDISAKGSVVWSIPYILVYLRQSGAWLRIMKWVRVGSGGWGAGSNRDLFCIVSTNVSTKSLMFLHYVNDIMEL